MKKDTPGNGLNTLGSASNKAARRTSNWFADCRTTNFVDNWFFLFTFRVLICFQTEVVMMCNQHGPMW